MSAADISLEQYTLCPSRTPERCKFNGTPLARDGEDQAVYCCQTCGLGVTRPPLADTSNLYLDRTSQNFLTYYTSLAGRLKQIRLKMIARAIMSPAAHAPNLVLDFGCGDGALTGAIADELGANARVVGLDFFEEPPPKIGNAQYAGYSKLAEFSERADIVTCFHVMEHDDDAPAFLARLKSLLRPGGILIVEVPNIDCVWTPWFGENCDNWAMPFHRLHFNRAVLRQAVEAAGLTVITQENVLAATTANSLAKLFGLSFGGLPLAAALLLLPAQWLAERLTGRPSGLRIYALKP